MRVLFWSNCFWPEIGGVEVLAARLLPALRERGHDFIVLANKAWDELPDETDYDGIPVFYFDFVHPIVEHDVERITQVRQRVAALKRAFEPDLVHHYLIGPSTLFLRYTANVHPAPLLVTLHRRFGGHEPHLPIDRDTLSRSTLLSADWVVACSATVLSEARRLVPQISPVSSAIPNAIECAPVDQEPLPIHSPRLLCVGRLVRVKGFDLALRALAALVDRFPRARLIVAGDGAERAALQEQAATLGVADAVDFRGWVEPNDVPALNNTATMLLMPSRDEGLPLVALQASQMARPVVATRVAGVPEVVVDGETGVLVEPEDSVALARAIAFLLDHPQAARRMGEAARKRARDVFGWERHVDAYDALYRRLNSSGSRLEPRGHEQLAPGDDG
jgi:glycogen(starch) synthase